MEAAELRVSIGIPAHNEEANIAHLLANLLKQEVPQNVELNELLVVADGCTDRTVKIVEDFQQKTGIIRLVELKERHGLSYAFNTLVKNARNEILVVINADTLPMEGSIASLIAPLGDKSVASVVGRAVPINDSSSTWGYIHHLLFRWNYLPEFLRVDFEGGCALRRDLIDPVPQDLLDYEPYVDATLRRKGYRIVSTSKPAAFMKAPENLPDFLNQRRRTVFMHLQAKKRLNLPESRLEITKILRTVFRDLSWHPRRLLWFLVLVSLSAYSYLMAEYDFWKGESYLKWKMVASTKDLNEAQ